MRIYLTGGTGLVGSNIIRLARQRNDIEIIAAQYGPPPDWEVDYQQRKDQQDFGQDDLQCNGRLAGLQSAVG